LLLSRPLLLAALRLLSVLLSTLDLSTALLDATLWLLAALLSLIGLSTLSPTLWLLAALWLLTAALAWLLSALLSTPLARLLLPLCTGGLLWVFTCQVCTTLTTVAGAITGLCATLWTLSHTVVSGTWDIKRPLASL
jgi:hypothetical protein